MKYLLITGGGMTKEIVESEPAEAYMLLMDLKYPNGFLSLTAMEENEGAY